MTLNTFHALSFSLYALNLFVAFSDSFVAAWVVANL
jgi:hypothetical protein